MKKKDFKLFNDTISLIGELIVKLIMGIKLIRQKKWYCTIAGISFIINVGNKLGQAGKLIIKTTDRLEAMTFDDETEEETTKSDKIQMGFHV